LVRQDLRRRAGTLKGEQRKRVGQGKRGQGVLLGVTSRS